MNSIKLTFVRCTAKAYCRPHIANHHYDYSDCFRLEQNCRGGTLTHWTGKGKKYREDCTYDKQETDCCVEELNKLGERRAEELASWWFGPDGITDELTAIFSSHKQRTLQTVQPIADLTGNDLQVEQMGMDCAINPHRPYYECADGCTSGSASIDDTLDAIDDPLSGGTILIGAHSGTIYKFMDELDGELDNHMGDIDLLDNDIFPRKEPGDPDSKVKGYNNRCRPGRAKRRPVVPGRRRYGRIFTVAEGFFP